MSFKEYLKEMLNKSMNKPDMQLEDISIEIPFVYKNQGLYLDNNKIGDFVNNKLVIDEKAVYDKMNFENCIDYFYDVQSDDLIENQTYMIETNWLDIYDIKTEVDSSMDQAGDEYTYIYAEDFEIYYDQFAIKTLISKKDFQMVQEKVDEKLSKDYKPRYVGTHRTYR